VQDEVKAAREETAALRRSNELLAAEAAGARDAVTDLLDRTSRAQARRRRRRPAVTAPLASDTAG